MSDGSEIKAGLGFFSIFLSDFPEKRLVSFGRLEPIFAFLSPIFHFLISIIVPKMVVLTIGDKHLTGLELFGVDMFVSKLIVPSIRWSSLLLFVPLFLKGLD